MKGKNFSCNNIEGKRKKSDFYETPYCLTQLLLDREKLIGKIKEPACGNNAIVKILKKNGYKEIESYDISNGKDFLKDKNKCDTIITNPPYSLSFKFLQRAKRLCDNFYFLLPLNYLHGKQRYDEIYCDPNFPLRKIYVFTRFPMFGEKLRKDGKINTGMMVFAWFCFSKKYKGKPEIDWLDINDFILSHKRKTKK